MQSSANFDNLSLKARTLLDKALDGETDAVKARVLDLVLASGINPEEEFFLLSLGLNHIKVLLHEAPTQLQSWSVAFQQTLDAWASSHAQTLQVIAQKAEATAALTDTAGQLATLLTSHTQTCNALIRQLQAAHHAWGESWAQQTTVNAEILETLRVLLPTIEQQTAQLKTLASEVKAGRYSDPLTALGLRSSGWKHAVIHVAAFSAIIGSIAMSTFAVFYIQDRAMHQAMAERIEYLLQKQNRRDCLEGVLLPESPLCQ